MVSSQRSTWLALLLAALSAACSLAPPDPALLAQVRTIEADFVASQLEEFCALGPRANQDAPAQARAREFLRERLALLGWTVREERFEAFVQVRTVFHSDTELDQQGEPRVSGFMARSERREMVNLLAERVGSERPEHWVELSAHYDTVRGTVGADDNASGVIALLEVARVLGERELPKSVRLCFFTLEEEGLQGSSAHVDRLRAELSEPGARHLGLLNLDSVGYADRRPDSQRTPIRIPLIFSPPTIADFILLVGNWSSSGLAGDVDDQLQRYAPGLKRYTVKRLGSFIEDAERSDHASYWREGLRAAWLVDTGEFRSPHYHRSSDRPDTVDAEFLALVARGAAAWAVERAGGVGG